MPKSVKFVSCQTNRLYDIYLKTQMCRSKIKTEQEKNRKGGKLHGAKITMFSEFKKEKKICTYLSLFLASWVIYRTNKDYTNGVLHRNRNWWSKLQRLYRRGTFNGWFIRWLYCIIQKYMTGKYKFFVALWNNKNKTDMREMTIFISLLSK